MGTLRIRASLALAARPVGRAIVPPVLVCVLLAAGTGRWASTVVPAEAAVLGPTSVPGDAAVLGVNVELTALEPGARRALLDRLAAAGVRAIRQPVRWADMEPNAGQPDWSALDDIVAAAETARLALAVTVRTSPDWARHEPQPPPGLFMCEDPAATDPRQADEAPPTASADLAAFASQLVARYRGRLWALEVWDEPNLLPKWRATGPDPEDYGRLLMTVAGAIRAADPAVLVVSAGLAPTTDIGVCYMSDVVFLDRLARTGALAAVDAVGIEPYGLRDGPAEAGDRDRLSFARAEVHRRVLEQNGVDRPLWAMAWGWNGLPEGWKGRPSPWGTHAPATTADWLELGYARARSAWPWMGAMFVCCEAPGMSADDPRWGFALLGPDGQPTTRWTAVVAIGAGDLPAPPTIEADTREPPDLVRRLDVALLLLAAIAAAAAWALRRRLAGPARRTLATVRRMPIAAALIAGAALAAVNAWGPWPVGAVALVGLVGLAAAVPEVPLALLGLAAPLDNALPLRLGPVPVWPVELMVGVALAGRLIAWYAGRERGLPDGDGARVVSRWHILDLVVLALVVWATASLSWAEHVAPAAREWRTVIVEPAVVYLLLRTAADRRRAAWAAFGGLVAGAVVASVWALFGLAMFAVGRADAAVAAEGVVRATGPYPSPNNLALYLGRMIPVLAVLLVTCSGWCRRLAGAAALVVVTALLATFSRGALLLGVPATAACLALLGRRSLRPIGSRRVIAAALVVCVLAVAVIVPLSGTARVRTTFEVRPGSTLYIRWRLWQSAVAMGQDHPWLGVGLDNFLYQYRDRYVQRDAVQERTLSHPHNFVLDWWTRLGVPGVALLVALIAGNALAGVRGWRTPGGDRPLAAAALGTQAYALAHGLVDNAFFLVDLALVAWIAQAAVLSAGEPSEHEEPGP